MDRVMRLVVAAVLALPLILVSGYSRAQLTIGLEAGLDDETMRMIEAMPAKVRNEIIVAVRESLVLVDKSVFSYLDRVDGILSSRLVQLQCVGEGLTQSAIEELLTALGGAGPQIPAKLQERVDNFPRLVDKDSSLTRIKQVYGGIEDTARKAWCAVSPTDTAEQEVLKIRQVLKSRARLWTRIPDGSCLNARSCLVWLKTTTEAIVNNADPRDVRQVGALEKLATFKLPAEVFYRRFDLLLYEQELKNLHQVSDAVKVVSALRVDSGRRELSVAQHLLATVNDAISVGNAILPSTNATELEAAARTSSSRRVNPTIIAQSARKAAELVPSLNEAADELIRQAHDRDAVLQAVTTQLQNRASDIRRRIEAIERNPFLTCGRGGGRRGCEVN